MKLCAGSTAPKYHWQIHADIELGATMNHTRRSARGHTAVSLLLVALVLGLTGCGDEETKTVTVTESPEATSTTGRSDPLSKEEFIQQGDRLCKKFRAAT